MERRTAGVLALVVLVSMVDAAAAGQNAPSDRRPGALALSPELRRLASHPAMAGKTRLSDPWKKVGHEIREVVASIEIDALAGEGRLSHAGIEAATRRLVQARADGRLRVGIQGRPLGASERDRLRGIGFLPTFDDRRFDFTEGWLPASRVEEAARLPFVGSIRAVIPPLASAGSVTSQGDSILRAADARAEFGADGSGVTVAVLSDSVDGMTTSQNSGDLPANVQVLKAGSGSGEGTAMLEIVHDLAPGASLAFYGPGSSGDMITGLEALKNAGAKVIVDDLTFFDQPHFEEGPVAQEVDALAAAGIVYVTSSGNFAASANTDRGHYEADYVDGGFLNNDVQHMHAFDPVIVGQSLTVLPGARGVIFLQWSDKFGQAADDYDLFVVTQQGQLVASSTDSQDGNDNPFEFAVVDNTASGSTATVFVIINKFSGAAKRLELYYSGFTNIQFATAAGSIAGHANASGAITVGAINASDAGADDIAAYSSRGPAEVFFPAHQLRNKPEITGIDGVAVTGAAGFPSPFFGTSAAAPHIGAIAALLLSESPALTPAQVRDALQGTADDLGTAGFDFVFGSGRADARDAVASIQPAGGGGTAPTLETLTAHLLGDTLTLEGEASDVEADIAEAKATLFDPLNNTVAGTPFFPAGINGQAHPHYILDISGLSQFPTATKVSLILKDAQNNQSNTLVASFNQADPGGPQILTATYSKGSKTLKIFGGGFTKFDTRVEINGSFMAKLAKVNKTSEKATITGSFAKLGLTRGAPNRIRVLSGGKVSNIFLLVP